MVRLPTSDAISVVIDHDAVEALTVARFSWTIEPPTDTYTISIGRSVSLTLDRHYPVRPSAVDWRNIGEIGEEERLAYYFGDELLGNMQVARQAGYAMMDLVLGVTERKRIAELQAGDACTPPQVRRASMVIMQNILGMRPY